jgi:hypothetical protein
MSNTNSYQRAWRKKHPHYHKVAMRKLRKRRIILGVTVNWKWLR